jgi:hypothetical protein
MSNWCQIEGCVKPVFVKKRRLCEPHYSRFLRSRKPSKPRPPTIAQNFWANAAITANPDKCWNWLRRIGANGYGGLRINKKLIEAHRYSFFLTHGKWPEPLCLHSCDNPRCVNPRHLRAGTHKDNVMDAISRRRYPYQHSRSIAVPII